MVVRRSSIWCASGEAHRRRGICRGRPVCCRHVHTLWSRRRWCVRLFGAAALDAVHAGGGLRILSSRAVGRIAHAPSRRRAAVRGADRRRQSIRIGRRCRGQQWFGFALAVKKRASRRDARAALSLNGKYPMSPGLAASDAEGARFVLDAGAGLEAPPKK
ncbi:hypothetical protein [Solimonas variicoloris]|uniref:hypothetical protein n=1 Tax=Solimonas variicoloris TaxID=254408 RepID=UPI0012B6743E|nr:hypothetical protein [Solimonas variicoloris]